MESKYIKLSEYCNKTKVEHTFISELRDEGILSIEIHENEDYINEDHLQELEMFSRWYYDLGVNMAGIDVMRHLINQIKDLQEEIINLKRINNF